MEKNRIGCLGVGLIIILCVSLFFNVILVFASAFKTSYRPIGRKGGKTNDFERELVCA